MSRIFNEATRVQMPAMVHLCRLGYPFYGKMRQYSEVGWFTGQGKKVFVLVTNKKEF